MAETQHGSLRKSKLKVLMTESSPNWGGQETRLLREANWLSRQGHSVIIACSETSRLAQEMARQTSGVRFVNIPSWKGPSAYFRLWQICRQEKPDIIHTRSSRDALWGGLLQINGLRVIRSRHLTIPERLSFRKAAPYRFGCHRIVAAAQFIADDLHHRAHIPMSRIDVVGEGVDLKEFHPEGSGKAIRQEFGIPDNAICFGVVAMIRGEKGHRHFVNAALRVREKLPHAYFLIIGDGKGSYADNLRAKIRENFPGPNSRFILAGYREDIPAIMNALDVLVVPSTSEAQTLVIPQAFACGKPVIASNVGGIPEIVTHGINGLLATPRDEEGFAAAMERFTNDPGFRTRVGEAAISAAQNTLSFDSKMQLLEAAYSKALE